VQQTIELTPAVTKGTFAGAGRRARRRLRNLSIGAASFVVVVIAASYVLMPGGQAVAATIQPGTDPYGAGSSHYLKDDYHDCPVSGHGSPTRDTEVMYGKITGARGVHVSDVTIHIDGTGRQGAHEAAEINVGRGGAYRAVLHLPAGQYQVKVQLTANGRRVQDTKWVRLIDERAYDVSALARASRIFAILPVSSY
jgi:hypothetical protein